MKSINTYINEAIVTANLTNADIISALPDDSFGNFKSEDLLNATNSKNKVYFSVYNKSIARCDEWYYMIYNNKFYTGTAKSVVRCFKDFNSFAESYALHADFQFSQDCTIDICVATISINLKNSIKKESNQYFSCFEEGNGWIAFKVSNWYQLNLFLQLLCEA